MKTKEEILEIVEKHHNIAINYMNRTKGTVVMTVLVGSQNYGLEHKDSDVDTYSFVLPPLGEIAGVKDPVATEVELKDGKCCIKDIRVALNLLIKTNPNSVEWFCSDYVVYNSVYERLMKRYINEKTRDKFLYCDIFQMGNACAGMSYQLKNRNMPVGKKFSHALRVRDMWTSYLCGETENILKFREEETRKRAFAAKLSKNEEYQKLSEEVSNEIADSVAKLKELNQEALAKINQQMSANKEYVRFLQYLILAKHCALELAKSYE